jgi:UDP-N-acetylmuramyl pentapeptide phosphotransferase/UDP-N-acetylglucosamine-1-phosphate transferase
VSQILSAGIAAFLVSAIVSGLLRRYRGHFALLDIPNERSLHSRATPRAGGLAILAGFVVGITVAGVWSASPGAVWSAAVLAIIAAISFSDDLWRLPAWLRFAVHLAASLLMVYGAGYLPAALHLLPGLIWMSPAWAIAVFCVLFTTWLVNLYNFMDGMDGLAGGMAVIGFATLALLGWLGAAPLYASAALMVAAAAGGFLPFNFPPARLFMGDVGSGSLGLLVALFLLWAERAGLFPLWLGALVFSPFIVDATWTVIRRALQGKRPWQAHREHFYQRLVQTGWSHRRATLWGYALMLKCSLVAVLASCFTAIGVQGLLLGWMLAVYLAIIAYVNVRERRPLSK